MNWAALLSAVLPTVLQMFNDPKFQATVKAVEDNLHTKVAAGAHPSQAAVQALGHLGAAAALHVTGNDPTAVAIKQ
jgi:ABC-type xylose transport system substrate-binding protein